MDEAQDVVPSCNEKNEDNIQDDGSYFTESPKTKPNIQVNKRGHVRPRTYKSKYQKIEKDLGRKSKVTDEQQPKQPFVLEHENLIPVDDIENITEQTNETVVDSQFSNEDESQFSNEDEYAIPNVQSENESFSELEELKLAEDLITLIKQKETLLIDDLLNEIRHDGNLEYIDLEEEFDNDIQPDEERCDMKEEDPITPGHWMSLKTCVLLVWLYVLTHNLSSTQISDLLTLINLILMESSPVFKSLYRFKRFFDITKSPFIRHYYCSYCLTSVDKDTQVCPNSNCNKNLKNSNDLKDYFLELPIKTQLTNLFGNEQFRKMLKNKTNRIKFNQNNIEDVYDSDLYKHLSRAGGPLDPIKENNLSFTLNTDGIPIFKSSKMSIWPVYLMINELPFRNRKCRENMILCGLWYGTKKPLMNLFCDPFHKSLQELEKGITLPLESGSVFVQGFLFCVSCDIPARSLIMNMNQHNGDSSCPKCFSTGANFRTETGGNIRVFPYGEEVVNNINERKHHDCVDYAHEAMITKKTVHGIKGPSFLMFCSNFNYVDSIALDYMHNLFLGTVRLLVNLWFGISHSLKDFSIYKYVEIVDERLCQIQPSVYTTRLPRSISDNIKFWKAAEFRSWFFYYSVPCVMDLLKPKYLYHYCALVEAIFLLNKASISEKDLEKSERLLKYFVFMMPSLYSEKLLTINIHQLTHFVGCVRNLGPLWTNSCFAFESVNGDLLKMFHGTQFVDIQMLNAVNVYQCIPNLASSLSNESPALQQFVDKLLGTRKSENDYQFKVLGKGHSIDVQENIQVLINDFLNKPFEEIMFYKKANIRGIYFYTMHFNKSSNRNSYSVKFLDLEGRIQYGFISWFASAGDEKDSFACISCLKPTEIRVYEQHHEREMPDEHISANFMDVTTPFIHFLNETNLYCLIPLRNILCMCICIKQTNYTVFCEEPNHHEINL